MMNQFLNNLLIFKNNSFNIELFHNLIVETERILTYLQFNDINESYKNISKEIFPIFLEFISEIHEFDIDHDKKCSEIKNLLSILNYFSKIAYFANYFFNDLSLSEFIFTFFTHENYEFVPLFLSITKNILTSITIDESVFENIIPIGFFVQFFNEELPNCNDEILVTQICKYITMILLFYIKNDSLDPNNASYYILMNIPEFAKKENAVVLFMAICFSLLIQKNRILDEDQFSQINLFLEENLFKIDYEKRESLSESESNTIIQLLNLYITLSKSGHANIYDVSLPMSILRITSNQELSDKCLDFIEAIVVGKSDDEKYDFLSYFVSNYSNLNSFQKTQVSLIIGDIILHLDELRNDLISSDIISIVCSAFENIEEKDSNDQSEALKKQFEFSQISGFHDQFFAILDEDSLVDILNDYCEQNANEAVDIIQQILSQVIS